MNPVRSKVSESGGVMTFPSILVMFSISWQTVDHGPEILWQKLHSANQNGEPSRFLLNCIERSCSPSVGGDSVDSSRGDAHAPLCWMLRFKDSKSQFYKTSKGEWPQIPRTRRNIHCMHKVCEVYEVWGVWGLGGLGITITKPDICSFPTVSRVEVMNKGVQPHGNK